MRKYGLTTDNVFTTFQRIVFRIYLLCPLPSSYVPRGGSLAESGVHPAGHVVLAN